MASSIEVIASTTAASLGLERALACAPPSTLLQGEAAAAVRGRSHEVGVEEERERWRRREEGNLGVDGPRPSDMDRVRDFFFLSRPFFSHPTRFLFLAHPTLTRGSPTTSRYARLACPPVRYRGTLSDRASTHALAYSQLAQNPFVATVTSGKRGNRPGPFVPLDPVPKPGPTRRD